MERSNYTQIPTRDTDSSNLPIHIDDLPDGILLEFLARFPERGSYCVLRAVCKKWRDALADPFVFKTRADFGFLKPVLFILSRPSQQTRGSFTAEILDKVSRSSHCFSCEWKPIRDCSKHPEGLLPFSFAVVGLELYLLGADPNTHVYSPFLNTCKTLPGMLQQRQFFVSGAIGNMIFIAGGTSLPTDEGQRQRLTSAESYNVSERRWDPIAEMPEHRSACLCEVLNGKLYVVGGRNTHFQSCQTPPRLLIYNPKRNCWETGRGVPGKRWLFQSAVLGGRLCVNGGGFMPYPATSASQPCWASPLMYNEEADAWEQLFPGGSEQVCGSEVCARLRQQASKSRVDMVAVEDAIFVLVAGDPRVYYFTLGLLSASTSCHEVWERGSVEAGRGKWRFRLRHPWHGHASGKVVKMLM